MYCILPSRQHDTHNIVARARYSHNAETEVPQIIETSVAENILFLSLQTTKYLIRLEMYETVWREKNSIGVESRSLQGFLDRLNLTLKQHLTHFIKKITSTIKWALIKFENLKSALEILIAPTILLTVSIK